jgi:hypothetical protein
MSKIINLSYESSFTPDLAVTTDHVGKNYPWRDQEEVDYSEELMMSLKSFLIDLPAQFKRREKIPFKEPYFSAIHLLLISIDAYYAAKNPKIDYISLCNMICRRDSATFLKRVKFKSIVKSWKATLMEVPDWWENVPWYQITDIGDIFNYQWTIFWKEEDTDDLVYTQIPLEYTSEGLSLFRQKAQEIIGSFADCEKIEPDEILLNLSGSSSFTDKGNKKNYSLKSDNLFFSNSLGLGKIARVPKAPGDIRQALVINPASLNRIQLIERQLQDILKNQSNSLLDPNPMSLKSKFKRLKSKKYFLHRDLTKEGLTKPRILLKIMLEELQIRYPHIDAFQCPGFYDEVLFLVDNKILNPIRGHGLGMANALTTLMQIIIVNMVIDKCDFLEVIPDFLTLNDDLTIGFQHRHDLEEYWDLEDDILKSLGLIRKTEKSFIAKHKYVIAENYLPRVDYEKMSYSIRSVYLAEHCFNIVQAKQLTSSLIIVNDYMKKYLEELITYWGYEFFPDEYLYPPRTGGWVSSNIIGVSLDLTNLENLPYHNCVYRAFLACQENTIKPWPHKKERIPTYTAPVEKMFPGIIIPEDAFNLLDIHNQKEMYSKYSSHLPISKKIKAWDDLKTRRQRLYSQQNKGIPLNDFLLAVKQSAPEKDFFPPEVAIKRFSKVNYHEKWGYQTIYSVPNPKLSYLATLVPNKWGVFPTTFGSLNLGPDNSSYKLPSDIRKRLKKVIMNDRENFNFPIRDGIAVFDDIEIELSYLRSNMFCIAYSPYSINGMVPVLKEEWRSPLIKEKIAVFGQPIPPRYHKFLIEISKNNKNLLKKILDRFSIEDLLELNYDFLSERQIEEEEIIEESEVGEDEIIPTEEEEKPEQYEITNIESDYWYWKDNRDAYHDQLFIDAFKVAETICYYLNCNQLSDISMEETKTDVLKIYEKDLLNPIVKIIVNKYLKWLESVHSYEDEPIDLFGD